MMVEGLAAEKPQLILGLLVCFVSLGMYSKYAPYVKGSDDRLAQVCQVSLFFSLTFFLPLCLLCSSSFLNQFQGDS